MRQTSIMLPEKLKRRAEEYARSLGVSFGSLVRSSLEKTLKENPKEDSLFSKDCLVFEGECPSDISQNHDDYLY